MARFIVDIKTEEFENETTFPYQVLNTLNNVFKMVTVQCALKCNSLQFYDEHEDRIEEDNHEQMLVRVVPDFNSKIKVGDLFTSKENVNPNGSFKNNYQCGVWNKQDDFDLDVKDYVKLCLIDNQ